MPALSQTANQTRHTTSPDVLILPGILGGAEAADIATKIATNHEHSKRYINSLVTTLGGSALLNTLNLKAMLGESKPVFALVSYDDEQAASTYGYIVAHGPDTGTRVDPSNYDLLGLPGPHVLLEERAKEAERKAFDAMMRPLSSALGTIANMQNEYLGDNGAYWWQVNGILAQSFDSLERVNKRDDFMIAGQMALIGAMHQSDQFGSYYDKAVSKLNLNEHQIVAFSNLRDQLAQLKGKSAVQRDIQVQLTMFMHEISSQTTKNDNVITLAALAFVTGASLGTSDRNAVKNRAEKVASFIDEHYTPQ